MRLKVCGAALAGMMTCLPAQAATIVQFGNEGREFNLFDPSLGTLNSATLQISVPQPIQITAISNDGVGPSSAVVTFDLAAPIITSFVVAGGSQPTQLFNSTATVAGTATIPLSAQFGSVFGSTIVNANSTATFALNTSAVTATPGQTAARIFFDSFSGGTVTGSVTSPADVRFQFFPSGSITGTESFRLTFDFTPSNQSAVPEPGTWATMLIGFGAIGASLRARRRRPALA